MTFLRINTFDAAVASTLHSFRGNLIGYVAAARVGQDQLSAGRSMVVDAVSGSEVARDLFGSDRAQRRVESGTPDRPGQGVPAWARVQKRPWEPFTEPALLIDNLGGSQSNVRTILNHVSRT